MYRKHRDFPFQSDNLVSNASYRPPNDSAAAVSGHCDEVSTGLMSRPDDFFCRRADFYHSFYFEAFAYQFSSHFFQITLSFLLKFLLVAFGVRKLGSLIMCEDIVVNYRDNSEKG